MINNGMNNGYYNPYPQYSGTLNTFVPVNGIEQAKAYPVAAGNSVMLMDANEAKFYIKTTDITGMAQPLRIFEFKEVVETATPATPEYVTKDELEKALADIRKPNYKKGDK